MASWTTRVPTDGFVRNLVMIIIMFVTVAVAAFAEGHASRLSVLFVGLLAGGGGLALWLGFQATNARLLALLALTFFMEYFIQTVGVAAGLFEYRGIRGQYMFGVVAWLVGACSAQALSIGVTIPILRRLDLRTPAWLNSLLVLVLVAAIPATAGRYLSMMGPAFWGFFALVGAVATVAAYRMPIHGLVGVVISGWLVGTLSEYAGAMSSGCWTFPYDRRFPPLFLVLACWPIEILFQFAVSAFLAGEPMIEKREPQAVVSAAPPAVRIGAGRS